MKVSDKIKKAQEVLDSYRKRLNSGSWYADGDDVDRLLNTIEEIVTILIATREAFEIGDNF